MPHRLIFFWRFFSPKIWILLHLMSTYFDPHLPIKLLAFLQSKTESFSQFHLRQNHSPHRLVFFRRFFSQKIWTLPHFITRYFYSHFLIKIVSDFAIRNWIIFAFKREKTSFSARENAFYQLQDRFTSLRFPHSLTLEMKSV